MVNINQVSHEINRITFVDRRNPLANVKNLKHMTTEDIGNTILENPRNNNVIKEVTKGSAPRYLQWIANGMRKLTPYVERKFVANTSPKRKSVDDLVNYGNVAKELACMVVYPLQVLTNPDLPKEKRRFVGLYDFTVTVFSLAGTLWAVKRGKTLLKGKVEKMMAKYTTESLSKLEDLSKHMSPEMVEKYEKMNPAEKMKRLEKIYPNVQRAIDGGAFVLNIAITTILFKRIIAPAVSPPIAAAGRKKLEARDAEKEKMASGNASKPVEAKPATDVKATEVKKTAEVKPEEKTKPAVEAKADDKAELVAANSAKPANFKPFAKVG